MIIRQAILLLTGGCLAWSQPAHRTAPDQLPLPLLGKIKPRTSQQISGSTWSIGGETLDRDFAIYTNYSRYLGQLGAKGIRLQAGWAKCESAPGVYSWGWLDAVVDDARAQGVQPWLELSYGNKIYPGGGDTGLGGGLPSSPEALAAWDNWARTLVQRYQARVREWEIWNEPDLNKAGTASSEAYAGLYIRTARIIRELQPDSRIYALGLAGDIAYAGRFLQALREKEALDLVDAITVHSYPRNPDTTTNIDQLRAAVAKTGRPIQIRQGETGAPSKYQENFALSRIEWTENMQAKWDLRRMLAHHAKDVPVNLFTISDMHYRDADGRVRMNYKGLLGTNPDQSISHVKPAYHAAQHVMTIFDASLKRRQAVAYTTTALRGLAVNGYADEAGHQAVVYWFNDAPPDDTTGTTPIGLNVRNAVFQNPVLVDLKTGAVYGPLTGAWEQTDEGAGFKRLPAGDWPLLIVERALVQRLL